MEIIESHMVKDAQFEANAAHHRVLAEELRTRLAIAASLNAPMEETRYGVFRM
jgi:hypothetical protein